MFINDQKGMAVTIQKIEFGEKETRVYVVAENKTNAEFNIYTYSAKIAQDGTQFEQESNYNADYKNFKTNFCRK